MTCLPFHGSLHDLTIDLVVNLVGPLAGFECPVLSRFFVS
jgi:hypothetical protein